MDALTLVSALLATIAAGAAAVAMGAEYGRSRRKHALCWTISLTLFAVASATLATGEVLGWSPWLFRVYYAVGGVLTVPWMALGAVYLFGPPKMGQIGLWTTIGLTFVAVAVAIAMPVTIPNPDTLPELKVAAAGWQYLPLARGLAAVANAGGTPVAIFLLLRASTIYRRKRVLPNKASGAIMISIGIGAAAVGGVLAAVESVVFLAPSLALGAVLMLAGFQRWNRLPHISSKLTEVPT
jgi:hypothetical protein